MEFDYTVLDIGSKSLIHLGPYRPLEDESFCSNLSST